MKTSELTGAALDWAVAKCEGKARGFPPLGERIDLAEGVTPYGVQKFLHYSTDWAQGGPIIEREEIELVPKGMHWDAYADEDFHVPYSGPTPLIAAMRCYVASKLGEDVIVPEGLAC